VNIDNCFAIDTQQKFPQKNKKLLETIYFGWNLYMIIATQAAQEKKRTNLTSSLFKQNKNFQDDHSNL
jgi:hypothetical protein|tara:strand:- start:166 stop:369 length:204 start_codon:yes stop_codon:yes gene_type:complete